jgi:PEGA domain
MTSSPSVIATGTTLAVWARERRRGWSDLPLDIPRAFERAPKPLFEPPSEPLFAPAPEPLLESAPAPLLETVPEPLFEAAPEPLFEQPVDVFEEPVVMALAEVAPAEPVVDGPSLFEAVLAKSQACATVAAAAFERLGSLGEPAAVWLMRGAAVVSTLSVVMLIGINRGELFARLDRDALSAQWDHAAEAVAAAARRPDKAPPAPAPPPPGSGRLTVAANDTANVLIDGAPRGAAPVTVDLPAGAHRVLVRGPNGSVERAVRIRAGESSEITEAIFPGWVALTTSIDLTLSEGGQPLARDDRGWAILPPGPHEIHLDNRALGVHEVRSVVVTPGDTTRLSFMPHTSTISLTTNEVAEVWIDGASVGQAPLVDQPIGIGVHDIRVRSAMHERWLRVRATVQPVQINVDLTAAR